MRTAPSARSTAARVPSLAAPLVSQDEHVFVFHRPPDATGRAFLGHLFVETRRHVPYLDELTDAEAAAVGRAAARAAAALRRALDPEHVFAAIVGRGVAHSPARLRTPPRHTRGVRLDGPQRVGRCPKRWPGRTHRSSGSSAAALRALRATGRARTAA